MDWAAWRPHYEAIVADFGFDAEADRTAAWVLRRLLPGGGAGAGLEDALAGRRRAVVVGCGPRLDMLEARHVDGEAVLVACDGATQRLRQIGVAPHVVVTDLDGDAGGLGWAAARGAVMVVHAHGDNVAELRSMMPRLGGRVVGTYQCAPERGLAPMRNVGGFTDGDRAVLLLEEAGVVQADLLCFDFGAPPSRHTGRHDPAVKPRKLAWAGRIVEEASGRGRIRVRMAGADG